MCGRLFEPAGSVTWPLNPFAGVSCRSLASDGPEPCPPRRLSRRAPSRTSSQSPRPRAPHRGTHSGGTETHAATRAEATSRCIRQCACGSTISRVFSRRSTEDFLSKPYTIKIICPHTVHHQLTARLAQSAERKTLNLVVVGSSPTLGDHFGSSDVFLGQADLQCP